ncbi:YitT family protein [Clostridium rectalis]|uniref:YitT family protein n=1 Tax=Clostridium rectalis TaxID=2040295 RepID=UPI000F63C64A|nr:YitT family protein [Clostridium rectalis]
MKRYKEYLVITFGVLLVALATAIFLAPNKIASGGIVGLAIIINDFIPALNIGMLSLIMNAILFIVAFMFISSKFGGKTIYASLMLSVFLWIFEKVIPTNLLVTHDLFLASSFGTLVSGIGMGIVFNNNASTGGTDILAKIFSKLTHVAIGKSLLIVDFAITVFSAISFGIEIGMYSLLSVIFTGFVIDVIIEGINVCKQVIVVSEQNSKINDYVINTLERGCTIVEGKGGYTKNNVDILYMVLNRREFIKLKEYIRKIDSKAFITVSDVHEVLGEGFKNIVDED